MRRKACPQQTNERQPGPRDSVSRPERLPCRRKSGTANPQAEGATGPYPLSPMFADSSSGGVSLAISCAMSKATGVVVGPSGV